MAKYEPIGFKNEVPSTTPLKYKIIDDTEGVIAESATIELETPVTPGTPLNAENLNHIEQGIVDLEASTPPGVFQAKGDLFVGAGSKTGVRLPIGANGRVLRANSAKAEGVEWGIDPAIDLMAAKGDLVVGTGTDQAARLPVGANGRVLRANSAAAQGVEWGIDPTSDLMAAKGDLVVGTGADTATRLPVGTNGQVLKANSTKTEGVEWGVDPAIDLIAAKGDLLVGTGADKATRLPVGANGLSLIADSTQAGGVKWASPLVFGYWTNTAYDGDAVAVGTYTVNVSGWGLPIIPRGIMVTISAKWAAAADGSYVRVRWSEPGGNHVMVRALVANYFIDAWGIIGLDPDGSGNFVIEVANANTLATIIDIVGYIR